VCPVNVATGARVWVGEAAMIASVWRF